MPRITILVALLLLLVGLVGYLPHRTSYTALIPAGFGLILGLLGGAALHPGLRPHAMHLAAALSLIAAGGAAVLVVRGLLQGIPRPLAWITQLLLALISAAYFGLCLASFVSARRRRQDAASREPSASGEQAPREH